MKKMVIALTFLVLIFLFGCSSTETPKSGNTANTSTATKTEPAKSAGGDNKLADPKDSIAYQFELLKAGDVDKLKECFTDRIKDKVTKEIVDKAKGDVSKYTLEDLFASSESSEYEGKKTVKVKMKNGRTLTTLVETNGKWLADTIWFN